MSRPSAAWVLTLLLVQGCAGDRDIWARYRAERALWHAERSLARLRSGALPSTADAQVLLGLDRVTDAFPAGTWASSTALARPLAREVARVSGRAALLAADLCELRGRDTRAEARYADIATAYAGVDTIADEASAGEARCLERLGRDADAAAAWAMLASRERLVSESGAGLRPWVAEAPLEAARLLELSGVNAAAESLVGAASERMTVEASSRHGVPAAGLWDAVAGLEAHRARYAGAGAALRRALDEDDDHARRAARLQALVENAAAAGAPDSAASYAAWLAVESPGPTADAATLVVARAWDKAGVADSALAVYKRLVDAVSPGADASARARFDRALLLERLDFWESARAELRTLATIQPTHECGLQGLVRIVRHHAERGERELLAVEARQALSVLDPLLASQRDAAVRVRVQSARAEVLTLAGSVDAGAKDYADVWLRYVDRPEASVAGFRAARLEDSALGRSDRARELYADLSARARDATVRRQARERLAGAPPAGR